MIVQRCFVADSTAVKRKQNRIKKKNTVEFLKNADLSLKVDLFKHCTDVNSGSL